MEDINTVLEKILTLNVNTEVNVEQVVRDYMMIHTVGQVIMATMFGLVFLALGTMLYKFSMKGFERGARETELDKMEEILENFDSWSELESLDEKLKEILAYMPRNKKPRKIED